MPGKARSLSASTEDDRSLASSTSSDARAHEYSSSGSTGKAACTMRPIVCPRCGYEIHDHD
jgi:hypothetical protein